MLLFSPFSNCNITTQQINILTIYNLKTQQRNWPFCAHYTSFISNGVFRNKIGHNYSRLRLIRPHQNTFVRINRSDELRVPFNMVSQWSVSNLPEAICPN